MTPYNVRKQNNFATTHQVEPRAWTLPKSVKGKNPIPYRPDNVDMAHE